MKKKNILSLDLDDDVPQANIAMLMFHSVEPNYAFADDLNHLYDLHLARTGDLPLAGVAWPLFVYLDPMLKLRYYLVERPIAHEEQLPLWTTGHKLLIAKGERAYDTICHINEEFCSATLPTDPTDLIAAEHSRLLDIMRSGFTTTTPIDIDSPIPTTISKKAQHDYAALRQLLYELLDYIDIENI